MSKGITDFVEILTGRSESKPDKIAYVFIDNKGKENKIRYGEMHEKVKSLAAKMQSKHERNTRAFLFFRPGLDFIIAYFACLYANIIAVPAAHSKNIRGIEKISKIFENADCDIFLTTSEDLPSEQIIEKYPAMANAEYILTDTFLVPADLEWNKNHINQDDTAFLQYTSGSTNEPKGVMITHGNLIHNQRMMRDALGFNEETVFAGWLPHYHDLGLIANILLPMFLGIPSILMAPMTFLQSPISWLKIITKYKVTSSGAPNFAFDFCVDRISEEAFCELDLSSWSVAFCGAEPINANSLRRFANKFSSCGFNENAFRACYGMAEATVFLTGANTANNDLSVNVSKSALSKNKVNLVESSNDALEVVSCGEVNGGQQLLIVDPVFNKEVKDNEVGEIWARGASITKGYWRNSKETLNVFNAFIDDGRGPYYKTGDLGFKQ
jgi:acyl-CoA synthetase (AMP-forming)/AMP-acid ligase II